MALLREFKEVRGRPRTSSNMSKQYAYFVPFKVCESRLFEVAKCTLDWHIYLWWGHFAEREKGCTQWPKIASTLKS